jgi:putative DNA primase/helicase
MIWLAFPGDFQINENVCHAVYRLGFLLEERKARVSIVCLPVADKLDDYLIKHSTDDFLTLHRMTLDDPFFRRFVVKEKGLKKAIEESIISLHSFIKKQLKPREFFLKPWLCPGTLAMIYSPRGLGKTWLTYMIALAITRKLSIGNWNADKAAGVLLLDGEMGEDERQDRLKPLTAGLPHDLAPFHILAADTMQKEGWPTPNLTDPKWREALSAFLMDCGIYGVLILDNLASLTPGLDENVKVAWDDINQWLLSLRFMGIAVILVHHAGKSGEQRGTSGREDNLDITIKLTKPAGYKPEDGAYFDVEFTKARAVFGDGAAPFSIKILSTTRDQLTWTTEEAGTNSREKIIALLGNGIPQKEIPDILHCAKSWVSSVKRKAIKDGHLADNGRFTEQGKEVFGEVKVDGLL